MGGARAQVGKGAGPALPEDAVQAVDLLVGATGGFFSLSLFSSQNQWGLDWRRGCLQLWVWRMARKDLGPECVCSCTKEKKRKAPLGWGEGEGTPRSHSSPYLHQLTREVGPGQRPSPGLNKKLLPLVLHQMYILTDLLEGHLWDKTGQEAALEGLGQCQELKAQYKKVPVERRGEHESSTRRKRSGEEAEFLWDWQY